MSSYNSKWNAKNFMGLGIEYIDGQTPLYEDEKDGLLTGKIWNTCFYWSLEARIIGSSQIDKLGKSSFIVLHTISRSTPK